MPRAKAAENPLLGNVRMLAMYRALLLWRGLGKQVDPAHRLPALGEAAWVAAAIGLHERDLLADGLGSAAHTILQGLEGRPGVSKRAAHALGQPSIPVLGGSPAERLLGAVGAAAALAARSEADAPGAVLALATREALPQAAWQRVFALGLALPLVLVVTPPLRRRRAATASSAAAPDLDRAARRAGGFLPVIPVDAGDPVAIYRVAQEALGRARVDRRLCVLDCADLGTDPLALLGSQLIARGIATPARLQAMATRSLNPG